MGRPKLPADRARRAYIHVRTTPGFKEWLQGYVERSGKPMTDLVERALIEQAKRDGFEPPPG